jgi:dTDP-4-dehydrorhamnose 3,5-epimerase
VLLSENDGSAVFVPTGFAHGFQALSDRTVMLYLQEMPFDATADAGIRFDSVGVAWPLPIAEVSPRDLQLPPLDAFRTPFIDRR